MIDRYNVKNPTIGTLYITATHIIFVDPETNKETWVCVIHYSRTSFAFNSFFNSFILLNGIRYIFIFSHVHAADIAHAHW